MVYATLYFKRERFRILSTTTTTHYLSLYLVACCCYQFHQNDEKNGTSNFDPGTVQIKDCRDSRGLWCPIRGRSVRRLINNANLTQGRDHSCQNRWKRGQLGCQFERSRDVPWVSLSFLKIVIA